VASVNPSNHRFIFEPVALCVVFPLCFVNDDDDFAFLAEQCPVHSSGYIYRQSRVIDCCSSIGREIAVESEQWTTASVDSSHFQFAIIDVHWKRGFGKEPVITAGIVDGRCRKLFFERSWIEIHELVGSHFNWQQSACVAVGNAKHRSDRDSNVFR
jgi:hypothetical protein